MSTRGSNDNLISLILFIGLYFFLQKRYIVAAIFYGLSVHFKIYPIIYAIPLYLYIDCDFDLIRQGKKLEAIKRGLFSSDKLKFALVSASVCIGL
jgi:GPI mannosyltransferase 1 subunit M